MIIASWWMWLLGGAVGMLVAILLFAVVLFKVVLPRMISNFAMGLFGLKAGALEGATLEVRSVEVVDGPPKPENEEEAEDLEEFEADREPGGQWVQVTARVAPIPVHERVARGRQQAAEEADDDDDDDESAEFSARSAIDGFVHWEPDELSLIKTPPGGELEMEHIGEDDLEVHVRRLEVEPYEMPDIPELKKLQELEAELDDEDDEDDEDDMDDMDDMDEDDVMKIAGPAVVQLTAYVPPGMTQLSVHYYTVLVGDPIDVP